MFCDTSRVELARLARNLSLEALPLQKTKSWLWTCSGTCGLVPPMDDSDTDLIAQLSTRIGVIMEDHSVLALTIPAQDQEGCDAALIELERASVEDLLFERGYDFCHETVRLWWNRFGPMFAAEIRRGRVNHMRGFRHWRWHMDEMYVKMNGEMVYLWRAVDHEGEVLESYVTRKRDRSGFGVHEEGAEAAWACRDDRRRRPEILPGGDEESGQ